MNIVDLSSLLDVAFLIGGFSLFGSSGNRENTQNTTNVTNDTTTTTSQSNNVTTNTANTSNSALTNNQSWIKNDSDVQNTALQLTDSFNRLLTQNLANVGNTTIGGEAAPMDYAAVFASLPQSRNTQTPVDLSKGLLDFNSLSSLNTSQLAAIGKLSQGVQTGFATNVQATGTLASGGTPSGGTGGLTGNTLVLVILGGFALIVGVMVLLTRKR